MKAAKHKILILSGDFGDGHKQAARALTEAAWDYAPGDAEAVMVDFMAWTHPHLHSIGRYCYLQWVTKFPSVYGYLFQKTRDDNSFSQLFKKVRLFNISRMMRLLNEVKPTVVVSTFPSAAAAMSVLKSAGWTDVPTVTVITDHTDHSYWIHPNTDRYIVGSERVRAAILARGISNSQISLTGIPVRPRFGLSYDRQALCMRHGLDPERPVVLVMGGGLGMIGKNFGRMLRSGTLPKELQFIIVCGNNRKLREQLAEEAPHFQNRAILTGYVDNIHELMAMSDLIVTKPGGLTTSEAIASELPMLLYRPLPGQERDNASYLVEAGLALRAEDTEDLQNQLRNVFQNKQILTTIREKARQFHMKNATGRAFSAILRTRGSQVREHPLGSAAYAKA